MCSIDKNNIWILSEIKALNKATSIGLTGDHQFILQVNPSILKLQLIVINYKLTVLNAIIKQ